ncbi:MAG TPA: MBL fold metallo-hydrolase [Anaerolineae bacterium]|nr:MBL fold metallo-hydrolase [Anaerolineae bacterium]
MRLTYIRWSMTIIETMGLTIITDPVFRMLALRQHPPSYPFERMPQPDLVFLSHTHPDHFEPATLSRLPAGTPVWMPSPQLSRASGLSHLDLRGIRAWEEATFRGVRLTAVPAVHGADELGLIVHGDRTAYFAGDTSLGKTLFAAIGRRWKLDAVLLPIGDLRTLGLSFGHIGPRQAPEALRLLGEPHIVVPTHYSGMNIMPFMYCPGTPRKLSEALYREGVGSVVAVTRPLETIEF